MREDTRSVTFGYADNHWHAFSGHKNFGVFHSEGVEVNGVWQFDSWTQTRLDESLLWNGPLEDPGQVNVVLADANNFGISRLVMVGTSLGTLWYSTDYGQTWCRATGLPGTAIMELEIRSGLVYACTYGDGIYTAPVADMKSNCAQAAVFSPFTPAIPLGTQRVMDVAFDGFGNLYACTDSNGANSGGLYKYSSGWQDLSPLGSYAYSSVEVSISEDPPKFILLGDRLGAGLLEGTWNLQQTRYDWGIVLPCEAVFTVRRAPDCSGINKHYYFGTEWGWYEGFTSGWEPRYPTGLAIHSIVPDPNWFLAPYVWLATADGIRIVRPGEYARPPDEASQGLSLFDVSFLAPSPASAGDTAVFAASREFGVFRSLDNGAEWHSYMPSIAANSQGTSVSTPVTALALHPDFSWNQPCAVDTTRVYVAVDGLGVFETVAAGSEWEAMPALPSPEVHNLVHTPVDPVDGNYPLFAAVRDRNATPQAAVYKFNPASSQWDPTAALAGAEDIFCLALPPNHDGEVGRREVFAGTDASLRVSVSRGATWVSASFPDDAFGPVSSIAFHPDYKTALDVSGTILVGRRGSGVFKSTDGGLNFASASDGLSNCPEVPTAYLWDFGDGGPPSSLQRPSHTYTVPGTYVWTLTASRGPETLQRTGTVKVYAAAPMPCRLDNYFAANSPSSDAAPLEVPFNSGASPLNCGGGPTFTWNFGDGSAQQVGPSAVHTYANPGLYTWQLTVATGGGSYVSTGQVRARQDLLGCACALAASTSASSGLVPLQVDFSGAAIPLDISALAVSPTFAADQCAVAGIGHAGQEESGGLFLSIDGAGGWAPRNQGLPQADRHVKSLAYTRLPSGGGIRLLCGTLKARGFYNNDPHSPPAAWIGSAGYGSTAGEARAIAVSPAPTATGCAPEANEQGTDVFIGGDRGVFWSNDGGETFRPLNQWLAGSATICPPAVNCLFTFLNPDFLDPGDHPMPMLLAGTDGLGIWYRLPQADSAGGWDWTLGAWERTDLKTGTVNKFSRDRGLGIIRAAAVGDVFSTYLEGSTFGLNWVSSGLTGANVTDIRFGQAIQPRKERDGVQERLPNPEAPSGNTSWGTVLGQGVVAGTEGASRAEDIVWEDRNGSGTGLLAEKTLVQSVIQLEDLTILAGTTSAGSGVWRSADEGVDFWELSHSGLEATSKDVEDFLQSSNGDVLCAVNGGVGTGGVFLSADAGKHWVSISSGFDSGHQTLSSIVASAGSPPTYYAGTYTKGSYATSITPLAAPVAGGLDKISGSSAGGTLVTVSGSGFLCQCPEDYTCPGGPTSTAQVSFGGIDGVVQLGTCTEYSVQVLTPAHPSGPQPVDVVVRNPDTRTGTLAGAFTFTDVSGITDLEVTLSAGHVVLEWSGPGDRCVYRSPSPQFDRSVWSGCEKDSPYSDSSQSGTDSHIYYFTVE